MSKVTVGCKLPAGLHMDLEGKRVTLNGSNSATIVDTKGVKTGLTQGVDKDFFDKWCAIHKDAPYVKDGLIFASEKESEVRAEAASLAGQKTGFEGMPQSDGKITPADVEGKV